MDHIHHDMDMGHGGMDHGGHSGHGDMDMGQCNMNVSPLLISPRYLYLSV